MSRWSASERVLKKHYVESLDSGGTIDLCGSTVLVEQIGFSDQFNIQTGRLSTRMLARLPSGRLLIREATASEDWGVSTRQVTREEAFDWLNTLGQGRLAIALFPEVADPARAGEAEIVGSDRVVPTESSNEGSSSPPPGDSNLDVSVDDLGIDLNERLTSLSPADAHRAAVNLISHASGVVVTSTTELRIIGTVAVEQHRSGGWKGVAAISALTLGEGVGRRIWKGKVSAIDYPFEIAFAPAGVGTRIALKGDPGVCRRLLPVLERLP